MNHSKSLLIIGIMLFALGCKKDEQSANKLLKINQTTIAPAVDKILKVRKFISVISHVPVDKVSFDAASKKYTFGNDYVEAELIESLYDKSNVYQAEYEVGDK